MKKRVVLFVLLYSLFTDSGWAFEGSAEQSLGALLPLWSVIPFVGILLSIALGPLLAPKFWHHHYPKVSVFWALVLAIPFILVYKEPAWYEIKHVLLLDYIPFILLLWALFTVSGGIFVEGTFKGTPLGNTILLLIGTFLASWTGTTGASMLLIRPVLRANAHRKNKKHIVIFFILLISNIGGILTPLGDPPLFLGFLHGVPFFWTLRLIWILLCEIFLLGGAFFAMDSYLYRKEFGSSPVPSSRKEKFSIRIQGWHNFFFLIGVISAVLLSGILHLGEISILDVHLPIQNILRDGILILMAFLSLLKTRKEIREKNEFSWGPIREVAILFAGIFITIIPPLLILKAGEYGKLAFLVQGLHSPWQYFWFTGIISSFLDNAPTYLTFLNTALGNFYPGVIESEALPLLIAHQGVYLKAISAGAVLMGANTYIGNAPNFMVRAIAEERDIRMPDFFGYMLYSLFFLIPSFIFVTIIFF